MSVLSRYVWREVLSHFVAVMALVLGVFLVRRFGALLADAAEGSLPAGVVSELLALRTLVALPSLLPVTIYLAIVLALGRLYQDCEMTALAACGVSQRRVARTVLMGAAAGALVVGVFSFVLRPWAGARYFEVREQGLRGAHIPDLAPGRFYEIEGDVERVFFAEARDGSGAMQHVFVQQREQDAISILFAEQAVERSDPHSAARLLTLRGGERYDLEPEGSTWEVTRYEEIDIRLPAPAGAAAPGGMQSAPSADLWRSGERGAAAELQYRLAMPVSTLVLALLALPLARTDPRRGKYARVLWAIFIYLVYRQLIGTGKDLLAGGSLPLFPGLWVLHAGALLLALLLARQGEWSGRTRAGIAVRGAPAEST